MKNLPLTVAAVRPMTRKFIEIPLEDGFKFYGIGGDGKRYRCCLQLRDGKPFILSSRAAKMTKLIGWQPFQ